MAAEHTSAMTTFGLRPLAPSGGYAALMDAGYLQPFVRAGITADRFTAVNTAKGPWNFIADIKAPLVEEASGGQVAAAVLHSADIIQTAVERPLVMTLPEVTERVMAAVLEAAGDDGIESSGRFVVGAFDSLSAIELSNALGKVWPSNRPFNPASFQNSAHASVFVFLPAANCFLSGNTESWSRLINCCRSETCC